MSEIRQLSLLKWSGRLGTYLTTLACVPESHKDEEARGAGCLGREGSPRADRDKLFTRIKSTFKSIVTVFLLFLSKCVCLLLGALLAVGHFLQDLACGRSLTNIGSVEVFFLFF